MTAHKSAVSQSRLQLALFASIALILSTVTITVLIARRKVSPTLREVRRRLAQTEVIEVISMTFHEEYRREYAMEGKVRETVEAFSNSLDLRKPWCNEMLGGIDGHYCIVQCYSRDNRATPLITIFAYDSFTNILVDGWWNTNVLHSENGDLYRLYHDETPEELRKSREEEMRRTRLEGIPSRS